MNRSIDCQTFVDFMEETLKTNIRSIEYQAALYELATKDEEKVDCYLSMADNVKILDFKQIIQIGLEKIEDINKYLNDITYRPLNELIDFIRLVVDAMNNEVLLKITNDIKRNEARMIERRMVIQSSLFELFVEFMTKAISTNSALIEQRSKLYQLAIQNPKRANYSLNKAAQIVILDGEKLLNIGYETIKELNERTSREVEYLTYRLELLAVTSNN